MNALRRSILNLTSKSINPLHQPTSINRLHQPASSAARRYHSGDQQRHRWYQDRSKQFIVLLVGSGLGISVYFGHVETVPYTNRSHLVLLSIEAEKEMGKEFFMEEKVKFWQETLPDEHPTTVRVRRISTDIIEALERGVRQETAWRSSSAAMVNFGEEHRPEAAVKHLDGLEWEVLVVDKPVVNAFCAPGGKIVVFTGLLEHFPSDDEIATIIGHEVAHAVARHSAEKLTEILWILITDLVILKFVHIHALRIVDRLATYLTEHPFSWRMETEADYIGMLLMASAGYDPQIAPSVYEKLGKVVGDSSLSDYLSTHPSAKTRAWLLARAPVMEKAAILYEEAKTTHLQDSAVDDDVCFDSDFVIDNTISLGGDSIVDGDASLTKDSIFTVSSI